MLGVGWTEMLIIGVVALIVIGPKDLPVVMGRIGKFAGQIRRMGSEFQREINRTTGLDEVRNLRSTITEPLKKTADEIRRDFNVMTPTGVKPTGAIKPADPAKESVAEEIRAAAGMGVEGQAKTAAPTAAAATVAVPATAMPAAKVDDVSAVEAAPEAIPPAKALVKAKRPAKLPAVVDAEVKSTALAPIDTALAAAQLDAAPAKVRATRRVSKVASPEPSAAPPEASPQVAEAVASDKPVRRRATKAAKPVEPTEPKTIPDQTEPT
jgi:sec-independent protein translocase protein TatB